MRRITTWVGMTLLFSLLGFAEPLVMAQNYAANSDVVLESVVSEVKAIPQDSVDIVGDSIKYVSDESKAAAEGVNSVLKADPLDRVEKEAMLEVATAWDSSNDIVFRSYKIAPRVGNDMMATGISKENEPTVDVRGFFGGLKFPDRTSAYYRPEFNRLLVRQTMDNMLAIEALLAEHHNAHRELMGHQVEIETKFVEVSQKTLNELGFNWTFSDSDGDPLKLFGDLAVPSGTDLLSDGLRTAASAISGGASDTISFFRDGNTDVRLVINAMEQADDTDVLSSPRIVTRSGDEAVIQVGEEEMFPERFRVDNIDTSPFVEHLDWNLKLMGVQMTVTPELRGGNLIDLTLHPKVIDVIGYDSYVITPDYQVNDLRENPPENIWFARPITWTQEQFRNAQNKDLEDYIYRPEIPEVTGSLPYFRIREMETQVTVADGSTIGMGGLIYDKLETFNDKVPVLGSIPLIGRLFRSEGEKSEKRNLMIFVTATEVDVNGRRNADLNLNDQ